MANYFSENHMVLPQIPDATGYSGPADYGSEAAASYPAPRPNCHNYPECYGVAHPASETGECSECEVVAWRRELAEAETAAVRVGLAEELAAWEARSREPQA